MKPKAFAIFDGGGVKGAAFAGCLSAADEFGIDFQGFAGTSAGSMVALLASLGLSGEAIKELLLELDIHALLDDGGIQLDALLNAVPKTNGFGAWTWFVLRQHKVLNSIFENYGLYRGSKIEKYFREVIWKEVPELHGQERITFTDLEAHGCMPLKILASSVIRRVPVVFSGAGDGVNADVVSAMRASISYPFVFMPFLHEGSDRLVDGGLTSNLPVFLFEREKEADQIPIIAFDLVGEPADRTSPYQVKHYLRDILSTALESSEEIVQSLVRDVHYVPISIPSGVNTFSFSLTTDQRQGLFDRGYTGAMQFFNYHLEHWKEIETDMHQLMASHAPPQVIERLLYALTLELEVLTEAENIRAFIFLPTGENTQRVAYVALAEEEGNEDIDLELDLDEGGSGVAFSEGVKVVIDYSAGTSASGDDGYYLRPAKREKIRSDRQVLYCTPIFKRDRGGDRYHDEVVGVLAFDSSTGLENSQWLDELTDALAWEWSGVFSTMLS